MYFGAKNIRAGSSFYTVYMGYDPDPDPVDLKSQIRTKVVRIRNTGLVIVFLSDSRTNDSVFVLNKISNGVFSS
jgi:hypothetical protein